MTTWFTSKETTPTNTAPSEDLARFVGRTYGNVDRTKLIFLDIGSGSGANARWLRENNFPTITLDSSPEAKPDICDDVSRIARWHDEFDCIFDINTLCHVDDNFIRNIYVAIYGALKPGGKFFSIHPAADTEVSMAGKEFCRRADQWTMRKLLECGFDRFDIRPTLNWSGETKISNWQIEASK